ncbi:MAG: FKBP-type peptidyl-prolyl cis-trans isomerase [Chloroflexi bacterium]|nr:FKBP-type peptidyl-prolyl cis-trans isomerase [Chloroflexota bacterium]
MATIFVEGALITDSGLQFVEIVAGDGPAPQAGDIIVMHFIGSLPDGTEFGNSYEQGEPATVIFGQEQLLPGWEEGVGLMKEGGKAQLILPPELAFGEEGYGMIPPGSQVILDIELISVEAPPTPTSVSTDDLVTTDSGLQYADLSVGDGPKAVDNNTVSTHYTMWVKGDSEDIYISSSDNREPVTFVLGRGDMVFPGWEEGVSGMKPGGKRLLVIPPDLALGEQGGGIIPPNATLIMEIELVEIREPIKMTEVDVDDYIVTESGLKYYDIEAGDGAMPTTGQIVVVHYTGWLEDGTQFDSSLDRGQPFTFPLGTGSVIPGWDEGLATMKVGGKRQLVIPAELGYGDAGAGIIPPGATLIFEVELLDIQE